MYSKASDQSVALATLGYHVIRSGGSRSSDPRENWGVREAGTREEEEGEKGKGEKG